MHRLKNPQKRGVFDGQHRLHALHKILEVQGGGSGAVISANDDDEMIETEEFVDDVEIIVEVYPVESQENLKRVTLCSGGASPDMLCLARILRIPSHRSSQ